MQGQLSWQLSCGVSSQQEHTLACWRSVLQSTGNQETSAGPVCWEHGDSPWSFVTCSDHHDFCAVQGARGVVGVTRAKKNTASSSNRKVIYMSVLKWGSNETLWKIRQRLFGGSPQRTLRKCFRSIPKCLHASVEEPFRKQSVCKLKLLKANV